MSDLELIETPRLVLGGWRREQLDDLVRLHGNADTARYLSASGAAWTSAECTEALDHWIGLFETVRMGKLRVTRKADGALVGRAGYGIHPPTGEPEIGYALYPQFRGEGYATEAASALRDWIFRDTDWDHFIGFADVRNAASLKILRGIGMKDTHVGDYEGMTCQFLVREKSA
ncbi:MAG: GNAT family N-acetyltransferase [Devosia sp.]